MKELENELHTTLFVRRKCLTLNDSGVMLSRTRRRSCYFDEEKDIGTALKSEIEEWLRCPMSELDIVATMNLINNAAPLAECVIACVLTIEGATTTFDPARFAFRPLTPVLSMTSVLAWKKTESLFGRGRKFLE